MKATTAAKGADKTQDRANAVFQKGSETRVSESGALWKGMFICKKSPQQLLPSPRNEVLYSFQ